MDRRQFLGRTVCGLGMGSFIALTGCRTTTSGVVLQNNQKDMVGNASAGSETFKPLVEECVCKLLARHTPMMSPGQTTPPCQKRICFVGIENKSSEELGDFKDHLTDIIDTKIIESKVFQPISRKFVSLGLEKARLRPDELFLPSSRRQFLAVMEQQGQPFDYVLFATLTSGTTRNNGDFQRDYLLTFELVDLVTGAPDKESAKIRKGYHTSVMGKFKHM